ncbi:dihydrolipoamide acetyltransferase component of pyruvate dehydrogenase complex [Glutamicibacter uratoxydans]|uniref:Dihydrolipoamide acetyltransferase component of pyruvate dehydrogenase complex n=1 Tax=Glutamicibacter uratoxydans TaxID=43667 RepID=A0A4Y4DNE4_GLUUR|nr:dihydrolipoamide acetyltransferase family protein [Glutamicibacter uratoxydans]GED06822.1 dihydrolipoamide acetyltransferase component of pyruvate dehydrogenase complex [Glutamicibacter uratoxydans]
MTAQTFNLPDLGEGLTESEVLNWKIKVGEHVSLNQIIAEVETAKAVVELPSPFAGIVQKLHADEGQVVPVGAALVTFDNDKAPEDAGGDTPAPTGERTPTLVGYGAPAASGKRPARRGRSAAPAAAEQSATPEPVVHHEVARSTPPVRKFARDHGIEISSVVGTGPHGLVLRRDVEALLRQPAAAAAPAQSSVPAASGGQDRRIKISAMRRATAKAMVQSAFTAPHATEFLTVDVTKSLELIDKLRQRREFRDTKVNFTSLSALLVSRLLLKFPALNSRWDEVNDEIIQFGAVNLGMAVASDRGLLVPVVKEAQNKALEPLAAELNQLVALGRSGDLTPAQLSGGTFSITNVGVFGVDAGTPILPPGQTGILALGQVKPRPWEYQGELALRSTCTLALSFDHRVVDGKEASEFLAGIGAVLEDPGMMNFFI